MFSLQFCNCWQCRGEPRPGIISHCWNSLHNYAFYFANSAFNVNINQNNWHYLHDQWMLKSIAGWPCASWACASAVTDVNILLKSSCLILKYHKSWLLTFLLRQSSSSSRSTSRSSSMFDSDDSRYKISFSKPDGDKYLTWYFQPYQEVKFVNVWRGILLHYSAPLHAIWRQHFFVRSATGEKLQQKK